MLSVKKAVVLAVLAAAAGAALDRPSSAAQAGHDVRAKAAGILDALAKIKAQRGRPAADRRTLTFSEAEFNAYIACRLEDENEPYVKRAEFKLLEANHVEGRVEVDLGDQKAAGLLPRRLELLFSAGFESRDGRIRIDMDKLFLGSQPVAPAFVDLVIGVASRLQGLEPTSLGDWYDLPPGVLGLETRPGQVVVIY